MKLIYIRKEYIYNQLAPDPQSKVILLIHRRRPRNLMLLRHITAVDEIVITSIVIEPNLLWNGFNLRGVIGRDLALI
jgi:hypothetical protein